MNLVDLLRCCCNSSSNSPDWLVSKDNTVPIFDNWLDSVKLFLDDSHCLFILSLSECLSETINDFQSSIEGIFYFLCHSLVALLEVASSLRMSNDHPINIHVLDLISWYLPCICPLSKLWTILACNVNMLILFGKADCDHVEGNGSDNNFSLHQIQSTFSGSNSSLSRTEVMRSCVWTRVLLHFQLPPKKSFLMLTKKIYQLILEININTDQTENLSYLVCFFFIFILPFRCMYEPTILFLCSLYFFNYRWRSWCTSEV